MAEPVGLYEERGSVALVSLNRPERLNTLTEEMVQGVADAIDRAAASRPVRSVVLRGEGRALSAGYDLEATGRLPGGLVPALRCARARSRDPAPGTRCATTAAWVAMSSAS